MYLGIERITYPDIDQIVYYWLSLTRRGWTLREHSAIASVIESKWKEKAAATRQKKKDVKERKRIALKRAREKEERMRLARQRKEAREREQARQYTFSF